MEDKLQECLNSPSELSLRLIIRAKLMKMRDGEGFTMRKVIFRVNKSRRLSWVGHVGRIKESRKIYRIKKRKPSENVQNGWVWGVEKAPQ